MDDIETAASRRVPAIATLDPLAGRYAGGPGVTLTVPEASAKISLRVHPQAQDAVSAAIGIALPSRPKTVANGRAGSALWLGPDEWLIIGAGGETGGASALIAAAEAASPEQSAVDVSDRFAAIALDGVAAEAVLAAGCPQDLRLRTFPVNAASRTLLAKAEVVLWRRGETRFELFVGRSFADYVWLFLGEAARSPAL